MSSDDKAFTTAVRNTEYRVCDLGWRVVMYEYPVVGSTVRSVGAVGRDSELASDWGRCIEQAAQVVEDDVVLDDGPSGYELEEVGTGGTV